MAQQHKYPARYTNPFYSPESGPAKPRNGDKPHAILARKYAALLQAMAGSPADWANGQCQFVIRDGKLGIHIPLDLDIPKHWCETAKLVFNAESKNLAADLTAIDPAFAAIDTQINEATQQRVRELNEALASLSMNKPDLTKIPKLPVVEEPTQFRGRPRRAGSMPPPRRSRSETVPPKPAGQSPAKPAPEDKHGRLLQQLLTLTAKYDAMLKGKKTEIMVPSPFAAVGYPMYWSETKHFPVPVDPDHQEALDRFANDCVKYTAWMTNIKKTDTKVDFRTTVKDATTGKAENMVFPNVPVFKWDVSYYERLNKTQMDVRESKKQLIAALGMTGADAGKNLPWFTPFMTYIKTFLSRAAYLNKVSNPNHTEKSSDKSPDWTEFTSKQAAIKQKAKDKKTAKAGVVSETPVVKTVATTCSTCAGMGSDPACPECNMLAS